MTGPEQPTAGQPSASNEPDRSDAQFADYDGPLTPPPNLLSAPYLLTPATLRGVAAFIAGIVLLARDASPSAFAFAVGAVVIVWALAEVRESWKTARRRRALLRSAGLVVLGVVMMAWPAVTAVALGRIVGGAFVVGAVVRAYRAIKGTDDAANRPWGLVASVFILAVGLAVLAVPETILELVLAILAVYFVVSGLVTVITNLHSDADHQITLTETWPEFFEWLQGRAHTADDRRQLYDKLFFEGEQAARRLSRFFILMGFATTIAAYGVISDSTAVVIGAMLIAPLMTPLMATSVSMTMGWPKRATMSAIVALGGILFAIGLSVLFGASLPFDIDPVTNSQVASRVSPTLVDLIIAIAAGGAGAFALSRPDVSDALPGVAVAIALVPPLAVVGLMLSEGQFDDAFGALLLFTTNLIAILLVGGVVFILTGVAPVRRLSQNAQWERTVVTLLGIAALVVIALLSIAGESIRSQAFDKTEVGAVVDEWLSDSELRVFSVSVARSDVSVVVVGPQRPPSIDTLGNDLAEALGKPVDVVVDWVPEERLTFTADD